jgi:hypothetical protein
LDGDIGDRAGCPAGLGLDRVERRERSFACSQTELIRDPFDRRRAFQAIVEAAVRTSSAG